LLMASDEPTQVPTSYPSASPYPTRIDTKPPVPAAGVLCSSVKRSVCVGPDACACSPGWSGADCQTPLCVQECANRGECVAPDTCACKYGSVWKSTSENYSRLAISAPRPWFRPKLGHDVPLIHSTDWSEQHLTQTPRGPELKHNLNFDFHTGTGGSTRTARRPSARRRAATAATARGRTRARARRSGLARTAAPRSVTRNARMGEGAWHQIRANVPRNGTATTAGCPSATRASSRLMGRRRPGLACPKTNRLVWTCDQERGRCTGRASSRSGATRRRVSTARSRSGPIRSWRRRAVRTTCM
jgi:hypothetical protein